MVFNNEKWFGCYRKFAFLYFWKPSWSLANWAALVLDFSQAQCKGLYGALREFLPDWSEDEIKAFADKLFVGCLIHFLCLLIETAKRLAGPRQEMIDMFVSTFKQLPIINPY